MPSCADIYASELHADDYRHRQQNLQPPAPPSPLHSPQAPASTDQVVARPGRGRQRHAVAGCLQLLRRNPHAFPALRRHHRGLDLACGGGGGESGAPVRRDGAVRPLAPSRTAGVAQPTHPIPAAIVPALSTAGHVIATAATDAAAPDDTVSAFTFTARSAAATASVPTPTSTATTVANPPPAGTVSTVSSANVQTATGEALASVIPIAADGRTCRACSWQHPAGEQLRRCTRVAAWRPEIQPPIKRGPDCDHARRGRVVGPGRRRALLAQSREKGPLPLDRAAQRRVQPAPRPSHCRLCSRQGARARLLGLGRFEGPLELRVRRPVPPTALPSTGSRSLLRLDDCGLGGWGGGREAAQGQPRGLVGRERGKELDRGRVGVGRNGGEALAEPGQDRGGRQGILRRNGNRRIRAVYLRSNDPLPLSD